ncbi:MAG: type II toxin-antitoxin system Phd/YefM family antitoxin [Planctomycetaceae bacterium]|jgi:prevent-host-death family protein|nr:type II toxin-antitoxin system Phd/YefM family antitoxin [Planctomycetaceae bacterium]
MKIYNYSEAQQNFSAILNTASEEDVIITRQDGNKFKLISINENESESPLENIKGIKTNITMNEILEAIRHGREDREYNKPKL